MNRSLRGNVLLSLSVCVSRRYGYGVCVFPCLRRCRKQLLEGLLQCGLRWPKGVCFYAAGVPHCCVTVCVRACVRVHIRVRVVLPFVHDPRIQTLPHKHFSVECLCVCACLQGLNPKATNCEVDHFWYTNCRAGTLGWGSCVCVSLVLAVCFRTFFLLRVVLRFSVACTRCSLFCVCRRELVHGPQLHR